METQALGEKDVCPHCGSRDVRAMRKKEVVEFYGSDRLVLKLPRICESCGRGWDVRPSRAGCIAMLIFSGIGLAVGLALLGLGIFALIAAAMGKAPERSSRGLWLAFGGGFMFASGSFYSFLKYFRILRTITRASTDEAPQ